MLFVKDLPETSTLDCFCDIQLLLVNNWESWNSNNYNSIETNYISMVTDEESFIDVQKERYGSKTFTVNYSIMQLFLMKKLQEDKKKWGRSGSGYNYKNDEWICTLERCDDRESIIAENMVRLELPKKLMQSER